MNIKLLSFLFLLGTAGATDLSAQEKGPRGKRFQQGTQQQGQTGQQRPDREARRQQMLERFDLDGDGKLNEQERQALRAAAAQRHQEQGAQGQARRRGAEGREGARGQRRQGDGQAQRPSREQVLKQFDTDGDSKLNEAERQALHQAVQQRRGAQGQRKQQGQFRQQGPQGDREQRRAQLMKTFDANQDGQLDEFERQALRETMKKRRAAQGQGQGLNPEARQGRVRQGRESGDAPQSDRRPRRR
ncbi:MAG: hypothetical protein ACPG31_01550 [Planctomycetota bacterium]